MYICGFRLLWTKFWPEKDYDERKGVFLSRPADDDGGHTKAAVA